MQSIYIAVNRVFLVCWRNYKPKTVFQNKSESFSNLVSHWGKDRWVRDVTGKSPQKIQECGEKVLTIITRLCLFSKIKQRYLFWETRQYFYTSITTEDDFVWEIKVIVV